jgi:hypothetical protein
MVFFCAICGLKKCTQKAEEAISSEIILFDFLQSLFLNTMFHFSFQVRPEKYIPLF